MNVSGAGTTPNMYRGRQSKKARGDVVDLVVSGRMHNIRGNVVICVMKPDNRLFARGSSFVWYIIRTSRASAAHLESPWKGNCLRHCMAAQNTTHIG